MTATAFPLSKDIKTMAQNSVINSDGGCATTPLGGKAEGAEEELMPVLSQNSRNGSSVGQDDLGRIGGGQVPSESASGRVVDATGGRVSDHRGRTSVSAAALASVRSGRGSSAAASDPSFRGISAALSAADPDGRRPRTHYGGNWCCRSIYELNRLRLLCGRIVNGNRVQMGVVFLIMVNATMMGIATFDFVSTNPEVQSKFEKVDNVFLIVFTAELGMQFLYHGLRLFLDGWLLFDFVVIVMSWAFAEAQIIRAFRIFRALRLVTRVRILRNLVTALFGVMPNMASIGMLLFLIMYIFCVMVTTLFKDMYDKDQLEYNYFGRLDRSFFTLFQIMTFDAWADVTREVMETYAWAWIIFIVYIILSAFIIVNLIIAVICDAIAALNDDDRAKLQGWAVEDSADGDMAEEEGRMQLLSSTANGESGPVGYPMDGGGDDSIRVRRGPEEILRRFKVMDLQVKESAKIQEQTALTVEYLIQQLQKVPSPVRKGH